MLFINLFTDILYTRIRIVLCNIIFDSCTHTHTRACLVCAVFALEDLSRHRAYALLTLNWIWIWISISIKWNVYRLVWTTVINLSYHWVSISLSINWRIPLHTLPTGLQNGLSSRGECRALRLEATARCVRLTAHSSRDRSERWAQLHTEHKRADISSRSSAAATAGAHATFISSSMNHFHSLIR